MSADQGLIPTLWGANAKKRRVTQVAFTTASAGTLLPATTQDGDTIPGGSLWIVQPTQDVRYEFASAAKTVDSTYVLVQAGTQEYCGVRREDGSTVPPNSTGGTRPYLSLKGETASGTCNVYVVY